MNILYVLYLIILSFFLAAGQLCMKKAVMLAKDGIASAGAGHFFVALFSQAYFWGAMVLCGSMVFFWAWILRVVPLSKAYPFVVLAFVFTSILEYYFLDQRVTPFFYAGCLLIFLGLLLILK